MDPVLQRRLAQQAQKTETGESAVEDVGSPEKGGKDFSGYDPVLAARLARQQKKAYGGHERRELSWYARSKFVSSFSVTDCTLHGHLTSVH